jgi:hypothetical protein
VIERAQIMLMLFIWLPALALQANPPVTELQGDLHVNTPTVWKNGYYRVHGNLWLHKDGELTVENGTVELACTYSREFTYRWDGGKLVTRNSTLGGAMKNGVINQAVFEMRDGNWDAKDTTIRYCYGITFGYGATVGRLRADNLIMGANPDSIILGGRGDVVLKNSTYMISLNVNATQGGKGILDLPKDTPVTQVFDGSNMPGTIYKLKLENVKVPLWFLFAQIGPTDAPPAELHLKRCDSILPCIMAHNLKEELKMPCSWKGWQNDGKTSKPYEPIPPGATFTTGNLKWVVGERPVYFGTWGVYLTGRATDVTLRGPMMLCENIVFGGRLRLLGTPGTYDLWLACTTADSGRMGESEPAPSGRDGKPASPSDALLEVRDAALGRFGGAADGLRGQITAHAGGMVEITNAKVGDLHLITQGNGEIVMKNIRKEGVLAISKSGGPVTVEEAPTGN